MKYFIADLQLNSRKDSKGKSIFFNFQIIFISLDSRSYIFGWTFQSAVCKHEVLSKCFYSGLSDILWTSTSKLGSCEFRKY